MQASVSVIIPTFNRRRQLKRAVESVLSQQGCDYELIVVDDGSEDDLSEVEQLVLQHSHAFFRTENRGVAAARNFGLSKSSGKYLAFLDSDDCWRAGKLAAQLNFFAENPSIRICQTQEVWFRNGLRINPKSYHAMPDGEAFVASLERCVISPSAVMLEKSLLEEFGGFDEQLVVCEDYDLWLKISSKYPVGLIKQELVEKYGGHADQLSRSQPVMDRFRVFSLVNLLCDCSLNAEQRKQAVSILKQKAEVIANGACKRDLDFADIYLSLSEHIQKAGEQIGAKNLEELSLIREQLEDHIKPRFIEERIAS